jgi:hypothetical protein
VGTPAYMAPEQVAGEPVDARADLFSLGCVLYRMCTGRVPFAGSHLIATLKAVATEPPKPPREWDPTLPVELNDLVLRLLEKKPEDRPASAAAGIEALAEIEQSRGATALFTSGALARPAAGRGGRRRRVAVAGGLLLAAVIVIRIKGTDGKETEIKVPEGSKVEVEQGGRVVAIIGPGQPAAPVASPLDKLDPAQIPAAERFDWQPKELVAVLGEHRRRHWGDVFAVVVDLKGLPWAAQRACGP